jgi:cell division protein FtsI/penicillin-binding protein 2
MMATYSCTIYLPYFPYSRPKKEKEKERKKRKERKEKIKRGILLERHSYSLAINHPYKVITFTTQGHSNSDIFTWI